MVVGGNLVLKIEKFWRQKATYICHKWHKKSLLFSFLFAILQRRPTLHCCCQTYPNLQRKRTFQNFSSQHLTRYASTQEEEEEEEEEEED